MNKSKCQVKGCNEEAKYFVAFHDEDGNPTDREICEACADKYYIRTASERV